LALGLEFFRPTHLTAAHARARNYWKSHNFTELSDGALAAVIEYAGKLPSPQCEICIGHIAGAANRVAPDAELSLYSSAQSLGPGAGTSSLLARHPWRMSRTQRAIVPRHLDIIHRAGSVIPFLTGIYPS
jgi:hypothetical protein